MRLHITHVTSYDYREPVELLPHRMMLSPRSSDSLQLISRNIRCEPASKLEWTQDVFGNLIAAASFERPTRRLEIISEAVVEQSAALWPILKIAPHAHRYPFAYSPDDRVDLGALLSPEHPDPDGRLKAWAEALVLPGGTDTLSLLQDVNAATLSGVRYAIRDEAGTQTPRATLDTGSGSCRDLATLFIEAVRHLGFAARAVSGYLFEPSPDRDVPQIQGQHGATHAWAEVYLPCAGWIAFDPTNGWMGEANLIAVAVGRSIAHLSPIAGQYVGAADMLMSMTVKVTVVAESQIAQHANPKDARWNYG